VEQFSESQAASRKPNQVPWRGLLKELVSDFIEACRNFIFDFIHKKQCCGSRSGSMGSVCFWDSWIWIRIR
jgi:hypothetical protein